MGNTTKKYLSEFAGLDLLRFLLSFTIVVYHYKMFFYPFVSHSKVPIHHLPVSEMLGFVYRHGAYAVEIFWLISGFIFYLVYFRPLSQKQMGFKKFSLLRLTRLYPLHFATLVLVAILQTIYQSQHGAFFAYAANDVQHFILHLFFISHWGNFGSSFNSPIWSVSIEIFVYILFYILCRNVLLNGKRIYAVLALAVLGYYFRFPPQFYECILFFFSGCLLCRLYTHGKPWLLWKCTIVATGFAIVSKYVFTAGTLHEVARSLTGLAASSCMLLGFIYLFRRIASGSKGAALIRTAGNITYSMYLMHFPIQLLMSVIISPGSDTIFRQPGMLLFFIAFVIISGLLVFYYFERPVQNYLRRKFNLDVR